MNTLVNILVVEDHDDLREVTVDALIKFGFAVKGVDCADSMDEELGKFRPDVVVLDLNLPGEDGLSIARRLRSADPGLGVIMMTARNQAEDRMLGYDSGADIYLTKPTTPKELHSAIRALIRRIQPEKPVSSRLELRLHSLQIHGPAQDVNVSDQELMILNALIRAKDHRQEIWQLLELRGKEPDELETKALAVQIVRIRKKLEQAGGLGPTIKSIRGVGYQLCVGITINREEN